MCVSIACSGPQNTLRIGRRGEHFINDVIEEPISNDSIKVAGFHHGSSYLEHVDFADAIREPRAEPPSAAVQAQISEALKHLALKHHELARETLQRVLEQAPHNKQAQTWIRVAEARQLKQRGDKEGAIALYRQIVDEIDPAHGEALKEVRAGAGRLSSLFKKMAGR